MFLQVLAHVGAAELASIHGLVGAVLESELLAGGTGRCVSCFLRRQDCKTVSAHVLFCLPIPSRRVFCLCLVCLCLDKHRRAAQHAHPGGCCDQVVQLGTWGGQQVGELINWCSICVLLSWRCTALLVRMMR